MDLQEISFKECLLVGRRAERRCADLFRSLARRLRPPEPDLVRKLNELAAEEERHEAAVAGLDEQAEMPLTWHLDEYWVQRVLEERFPSLYSGEEHADVDPATVRFLVRLVEEESCRFYRELAGRAPDPGSRALIRDIARSERSHRAAME